MTLQFVSELDAEEMPKPDARPDAEPGLTAGRLGDD